MPDSLIVPLPDLAATETLARRLASIARAGDCILLEGPLGAGKTALARAFLREAAGDEAMEVPSPSFTLVQIYDTAIGPVFHYDLWRLDGPDSLTELDWEDALDAIVLVEWPDRLGPLRPPDALTITLRMGDGEAREATLTGWEDRIAGLVPSLTKTRRKTANWIGKARPAGMNRDDLIALFLARNGFSPDHLEPLAQDASFRRYLRIRGDRPAVLMDAPPPEDVRPFLRIAAHLRSIGLRVPTILAADEARGLVLEEDLGDDLVSVLLDRGDPVDRLLDAAVDALVVMQRAAPPDDLPLWDSPTMASTASGTLFDWWWPARFGAPAPRRPATMSRTRWRRCWNRSRPALPASSIGISSPATCSGCRISDSRSSTSRARPSAIRLTTSCRCCRTHVATSRMPRAAARWTGISPRGLN